jgi:hypothetical protein
MNFKLLRAAACAALLGGLTACAGGSTDMGTGPGNPDPTAQTTQMAMIISDAPSDD